MVLVSHAFLVDCDSSHHSSCRLIHITLHSTNGWIYLTTTNARLQNKNCTILLAFSPTKPFVAWATHILMATRRKKKLVLSMLTKFGVILIPFLHIRLSIILSILVSILVTYMFTKRIPHRN
jgi:hypothetical protein